MPKARAIVATTNPSTGEPIAAGASVDLDDESYNALRQAGAVEASEEDVKANAREYDEKTGTLKEGTGEGNYSARTGRAEAAQTTEQPKAEEQPKPRQQEEPPKKR